VACANQAFSPGGGNYKKWKDIDISYLHYIHLHCNYNQPSTLTF